MKIKFNQLFVFMFAISMFVALSSGASWPLSKSATCNLFNYTGINCDQYWCVNVLECNYDAIKESCICIQNVTINNTIYVNVTQNYTDYVNISMLNLTANETAIIEKCRVEIKNYTDSQIVLLRDSQSNYTDRLFKQINTSATYETDTQPVAHLTGTQIVVIVFVVIGLLAYIVSVSVFRKKEPKTNALSRTFDIKNADKLQVKKPVDSSREDDKTEIQKIKEEIEEEF